MRRYSVIVILLATALLGMAVFVSAYAYRNTLFNFSFAELYRYQLDKLRHTGMPETVFVGDSSLGNAIDVAHWEQLSGKPAVSLALTGAYGYAGSLNMLKRTGRLASLQTVIIVQTPDLASREDAHSGYVHSYDGWFPLGEVPLRALAAAYLNIDTVREAVSAIARGRASDRDRIENDYIRQGKPLSAARIQAARHWSLSPASLRPDNLAYLRAIGAWCGEHGHRCVYAHGPLLEPMCRNIPAYIDQLNHEIRAAGLLLASDDIPCIPIEDVGDAEDHVQPRLKPAYTERYFRATNAALHRGSPSP